VDLEGSDEPAWTYLEYQHAHIKDGLKGIYNKAQDKCRGQSVARRKQWFTHVQQALKSARNLLLRPHRLLTHCVNNCRVRNIKSTPSNVSLDTLEHHSERQLRPLMSRGWRFWR
jgi:hypothetical protein